MAKWQKKVAIFAAGSIVVGLLTIAAGAMVGGVEDVNRIYLAPEKEPEVITKEYDKIDKLDLNLNAEHTVIEVADVKKLRVIETKFGGETSRRVNVSVSDGTLKLETTQDVSLEPSPSINTDILSILRTMRRRDPDDFPQPLRIQIPEELVLEDIQLQFSTSVAFAGVRGKHLTVESGHDSYLNLSDSGFDKMEGTLSTRHFSLDNSQLKEGKLTLNGGGYVSLTDSHLENMIIESQSTYFRLDKTLLTNTKLLTSGFSYEGSETYYQDRYGNSSSMPTALDLLNVTYQGDVVIEASNGAVNVVKPPAIDKVNLDLTVERGDIMIDLKDVPRTYISDDIKSVYNHKGKESKANVKVSVTNGNISLHD